MQAFTAPLLMAVTLVAGSPAFAASGAPAPAHAAGHAPAKADTVTSDVRCLLTMVAFSNINKDHPQAAQFGIHFFVGRINGRAPGLDLAAAVKAQAPTLGPEQLQAELKRCGPIVSAAGQGFEAAMNGLRPPGAPPPGPAAPPAAAPAPAPPK
ncbi:hypothetical protein [Phenylobacterium sp.]|uniref:hypothetical protein n=1 Tax=Phenylobacterium sp. TaxID=1871053 RepID=UPI0012277C6A|nr:hypothetical protein [Phenylobacterium sp.]THD70415.1 MAG: hypothetical protein E8A12_03175 [Phenylobacterium sp.]